MRFLTPILDFLKKHYEKIILSVVLIGLAVAAVWMGSFINNAKKDVDNDAPAPRSNKAITPLDLTTDLLALAAVTNPPPVVLSGEHNLFNPVTWRRKTNGELSKFFKIGPDALTVLNIVPLYMVISYDHPSPNGGGVYVMAIQQNSAKKPTEFAKKDEKKKLYTIVGIKGAADNPDALQLEIADTGETVTVSSNNPYKTVDGYVAELRYDPDSKTFNKQRVGETITLDNEPYKIVEITNNLVRVKSVSTTKETSIKWNGSP